MNPIITKKMSKVKKLVLLNEYFRRSHLWRFSFSGEGFYLLPNSSGVRNNHAVSEVKVKQKVGFLVLTSHNIYGKL